MNLFGGKTKSASDVDRSHNKLIDAKFIEVKKRMGGTGANSVNSCWIAEDLLWMRMVACTEVILEALPPEEGNTDKKVKDVGIVYYNIVTVNHAEKCYDNRYKACASYATGDYSFYGKSIPAVKIGLKNMMQKAGYTGTLRIMK